VTHNGLHSSQTARKADHERFDERPALGVFLGLLVKRAEETWHISHYQVSRSGQRTARMDSRSDERVAVIAVGS
jgi:hypothetical protein